MDIVRTSGAAAVGGLTAGLFMHNAGRSMRSSVLLGAWLFGLVVVVAWLESTRVFLVQPRTSRLGAPATVCLGGALLTVTLLAPIVLT